MREIDQRKIEGGIILIDKPYEWTSFDVVKKLRNALRFKKIGHAGTLDPLATGMLVVCYGKFTKRIEEIQAREKRYIAEIKLGATTPSFDLETEIDEVFETSHISLEKIQEVLNSFKGETEQYPPKYSAVKINGKRAYEYARGGEEVEMKPRMVQIYELNILSFEDNVLLLDVLCGKGTYIRSLARDIGAALDSGAHLSNLRRTQIGPFHVDKSFDPLSFNTEEDFYLHSLKEIESSSSHR